MQKLTQRQEMVLQFIQASIMERGYPPTLREIGNHMGIRSTNGVNDHLRALERKGYLTREDMKSRALRPTNPPVAAAGQRHGDAHGDTLTGNLVEIPILGRVAAGALQEAMESSEDTVQVDRVLIGGSQNVFGLRINGESMIDAGINNGDYVFVRKQIEATRGEIVIALVGDEATCKYYFPETDGVHLRPANRAMTDIVIPRGDWRSTQILGVVVGLYRKFN
ncbi:MAG: transcriptional repressor LexA [Myxococcales bacterium]|nr:transcriptional repressor LexA [Myxococcales bacterium]MDD9967889.1 transcriptional repressor LexA [Myxococcales bacterium]